MALWVVATFVLVVLWGAAWVLGSPRMRDCRGCGWLFLIV